MLPSVPFLRSPLLGGGGGGCRWGRPRSAGTIALHQPGQAQGSAWLRRGLIITCHRPSASLGLSHPGGGSEEGILPGGHLGLAPTSLLGPSRDTCLLWSLSTFHIPFFSSYLPSSTPHLGQASPHQLISALAFGRLTAGPGRNNFLCLEPNWMEFPYPSLHQRATSSQPFWPKGAAPEATLNLGCWRGGGI